MLNPELPVIKNVPAFPRTDRALPVFKGRLRVPHAPDFVGYLTDEETDLIVTDDEDRIEMA